jgi:hypothetical protein
MIFSATNVGSGMEFGSSLPHYDVARRYLLPAEQFYT